MRKNIMNLLEMKSGNVMDPALIRGIVKFPGKGIVFKMNTINP